MNLPSMDLLSPPAPEEPSPAMRAFGDVDATRANIYRQVFDAAQNLAPVKNNAYTLQLKDPEYIDPERWSLAQQKEAILTGGNLGRRLRGTWELVDNATGAVVDRRRQVVGSVPYFTPRGTFIHGGNEYILRNQQRLRSGLFTRKRNNGEIETHANILPGKGLAHRYYLDPAKGVFYIRARQARLPLMPLVKALGATPAQLRESWGPEIYAANYTADEAAALAKLKSYFLKPQEGEDELSSRQRLVQAFAQMELDPEVTRETMGREFKGLDLDAILAVTKRLIAVSRGEADVDDRDALPYQQFYGPEDLFAERLTKDWGGLRRQALFKIGRKGSLAGMPSSALSSQLESAILRSGLGQCFDAETSVLTRRGFVRWPDVVADDEFACQIDGKLVYARAYKLFKHRYVGKLLGCRGKRFSYLVTPNHRLWCKAKPFAEYRCELAEAAHGLGRYFQTSLPLFGAEEDADFVLGNRTIPGDLWARFLGWYLAEGWISRENQRTRVCLAQDPAVNTEGHADIVQVLTELSFHWIFNSSNKTFLISDDELATELSRYGERAHNKRVPRYCFRWSTRRLRLLADAYLHGDGNEYNGYVKSETTSAGLAEDCVELYSRLGGTGLCSFRPLSRRNPKWRDSYVVSFSQATEACITSDTDNLRRGRPPAYFSCDYDGYVYCAAVPGEMLYVLRNGKPHWSLNSLEEINPGEILDKLYSLSRLGEGGIPSLDAVPEEARDVQPSHYGFVDPLRTPESLRVGIDLYLTRGARKGQDGRLYAEFQDLKTGKTLWRNPQQLAKKVITFPKALQLDLPRIPALKNGKFIWAKRDQIDLVPANFENAFSPLANLVPMKSAIKGQRVAMASRMLTQAMPLAEGEAPLVQSAMPGTQGGRSYEEEYAATMGALAAPKPGRVLAVTPNAIQVQYDDGTTDELELYQTFPFNRKTFLHQTPVVRPGQQFAAGGLLARSNYTDGHGAAALGRNLRTAYLSWGGLNFEDATVISESAAKKFSSEHLYQHELETDEKTRIGKTTFLSQFPGKFDRPTLEKLDAQGLVKPGTTVEYGDPLILGVGERDVAENKVHRKGQAAYADRTVTWEHHDPGVVTDVVMGKKGPVVVVKSLSAAKVGDKLCFDVATDIRTKRGWVPVAEITSSDWVATLNPITDELEWQQPTHVWAYDHAGPMYYLNTKQINMLVTMEHRLWVARPGEAYQAITAQEFFQSRGEWQFKKDCRWGGVERAWMEFPAHNSHTSRDQVLSRVSMDDWLEFLGYYLSEGSCSLNEASGSRQVRISQFSQSDCWADIQDVVDRLGLRSSYNVKDKRFEINSRWLYEYLLPLGDSYSKFVPEYVQELCPRQLLIFLDAYLKGDGHQGACWEYGSSSKRLAEDVQLVCMKLGWCVQLRQIDRTDNFQKHPHWRGRINRRHLRPWWKKVRAKQYRSVEEKVVQHAGKVYCVTVPNHIIYVRREDKSYWSLNSGRYG